MGKVALRGTYVEFVHYMGIHERYPDWFSEELYGNIFQDDSRYTFWVNEWNRTPDYHEKQLVDDFSVFIRKPGGEVHLTDWDAFSDLFTIFRNDTFTNSGLAALNEDCIDYVECQGGELLMNYPEWFEDYFKEAVNFPGDETIYFYNKSVDPFTDPITVRIHNDTVMLSIDGDVSVESRCVFLRNKFGEIRGMGYEAFVRFYDPYPEF